MVCEVLEVELIWRNSFHGSAINEKNNYFVTLFLQIDEIVELLLIDCVPAKAKS